MGHQQNGAAATAEFGELIETFVRERFVPDGKHFVHEQNIWVDIDRDRKSETHVHAGRVGLHRRVDEFIELCKPDDLVEAAGDFAAAETEHQSIDVYVLAAGDLRMKSRAELDERRHTSVDANRSRCWLADP